MSAAVLSIGSNVGDRAGFLQGCVQRLGGAVRSVSGSAHLLRPDRESVSGAPFSAITFHRGSGKRRPL